jgi:hypothetical protein
MSRRTLVKSVAAASLAVAAAVGVAAIPDQAHAGDPGMIQGGAGSFVPWWNVSADKPGRVVNAWVMWDTFALDVKLGLYNSSTPSGQTFTTWNALTCPGGGAQIGAAQKNWSGITTATHVTRCPGWATPAWIIGMVDLTP